MARSCRSGPARHHSLEPVHVALAGTKSRGGRGPLGLAVNLAGAVAVVLLATRGTGAILQIRHACSSLTSGANGARPRISVAFA
jgi:hypothetical protein